MHSWHGATIPYRAAGANPSSGTLTDVSLCTPINGDKLGTEQSKSARLVKFKFRKKGKVTALRRKPFNKNKATTGL